MRRLAAIGVRRLAGRNSEVTRLNTPKVNEDTADHDAFSGNSADQAGSTQSLIANDLDAIDWPQDTLGGSDELC